MYSQRQHFLIQAVKKLSDSLGRVPHAGDWAKHFPHDNIILLFGSYDGFLKAAGLFMVDVEDLPRIAPREPRTLTVDIELSPMLVWSWGIRDQYHDIGAIKKDWSILSWAAKWKHKDEVMYQDTREQDDYGDDRVIVGNLFQLICDADQVISQNGIRFDIPKIQTRAEKHGYGRITPFKHSDCLKIVQRHFGLTSNKLAYSSEFFNKHYTKLKHEKYGGMKLWLECLNGNQDAWKDMKEYNCHDVLATEELYFGTLIRYDNTINYAAYTQMKNCCPNCGSDEVAEEEKAFYTKAGAYVQWKCKKCGTYCSEKTNQIPLNVRKAMLK